MPIDNNEFRAALGSLASGVTVVTTVNARGETFGITVSAFCSVSLDPPLVLICIDKGTASHYAFLESRVFAVNLLRSDQANISEQFAAPFPDKFEDIDFELGELGLPVLTRAITNIECRVVDTYEGGDHTIFVGLVEHTRTSDGAPLVYYRGDYGTFAG